LDGAHSMLRAQRYILVLVISPTLPLRLQGVRLAAKIESAVEGESLEPPKTLAEHGFEFAMRVKVSHESLSAPCLCLGASALLRFCILFARC